MPSVDRRTGGVGWVGRHASAGVVVGRRRRWDRERRCVVGSGAGLSDPAVSCQARRVRSSRSGPAGVRRAVLAAALLVAAACGQPASDPAGSSGSSGSAAMLAGWQLTLPVPGSGGGAAIVNPAAVTPPWLTTDTTGALVFWAPVAGVTTPHSPHARTELDRLDDFTAGGSPQTLSATVTVSQVPSEVPEVIVGQIHGAGTISSVPFVMLFYGNGAVRAVVKQEQSGNGHTDVPLLTGVPVGTAFDYTITDAGDGNLAFTAGSAGRTATGAAPIPAAFAGAPVRFQAGAYQQAPSSPAAAPDDGARVTFSAITVTTGAAPP